MSSKPSLVHHETENYCTKSEGVLHFLLEGYMHGKTELYGQKCLISNLSLVICLTGVNVLIYKNVISSKIHVKNIMHINPTYSFLPIVFNKWQLFFCFFVFVFCFYSLNSSENIITFKCLWRLCSLYGTVASTYWIYNKVFWVLDILPYVWLRSYSHHIIIFSTVFQRSRSFICELNSNLLHEI